MKKILASFAVLFCAVVSFALPAPNLSSEGGYYAQVRALYNAGKPLVMSTVPHAMAGRTMYADGRIAGDILYVRKGSGVAGPLGGSNYIIAMVGEQFRQPDVYDSTYPDTLEELARAENGGGVTSDKGVVTFVEKNPLGRWEHSLRRNGKYIVMRTNIFDYNGLQTATTYSYFFKVIAK